VARGQYETKKACYPGNVGYYESQTRFLGALLKGSLLAGTSLGVLALASGVQAADLGPPTVYKTPPLAPWSWTGFYLGGNVGAAWGQSTLSNNPGTLWLGAPANANTTSIIGGVQAGYNWQINSVVLGVEGDFSFAGINRTVLAVSPVFPPETYSSKITNLGTIRGRIGWAFDRTLVYATGGAAFATINDSLVDTGFPFVASPNSAVSGWTVGGGLEYAVTQNWTARVEYLHVGFANRSAAALPVPPAPYVFAFADSIDIARVGINYKF